MLFALGGVWSVIRGLLISFRSPQAGRVVLGLREAKVRNPVVILDELDRVGGATTNFGDPSAALLDPAQNTHFRDAYVEAPFDLAKVLFIATANDVAKIPPASGPARDHRGAGVHRRREGRHRAALPAVEQLQVNGLAGGFWTLAAAVAHGGRAAEASGAAATRRRLAVEVLDGASATTTRSVAAPASSPSGPLTADGVDVTDAAIEVTEQVPWPRAAERLDAPERLREALDRETRGPRPGEGPSRRLPVGPSCLRGVEAWLACTPSRPRSCASAGHRARAEPLLPGPWSRLSTAGPSGCPWPASRILGAARSAPEAGSVFHTRPTVERCSRSVLASSSMLTASESPCSAACAAAETRCPK